MLRYVRKSNLIDAPRKLTVEKAQPGQIIRLTANQKFQAKIKIPKNHSHQENYDATKLFNQLEYSGRKLYPKIKLNEKGQLVKPDKDKDGDVKFGAISYTAQLWDEQEKTLIDEINGNELEHYLYRTDLTKNPTEIVTKEVSHTINGHKIRGFLAYPKFLDEKDPICFKQRKRPVIVNLNGLRGIPEVPLTIALANKGYVSLSLYWTGVNQHKSFEDGHYDLNFFENALKYIKTGGNGQIPQIDGTKIAFHGISRGGELAYQMALRFNQDNSIKFIDTDGSPVWNSCFYPYIYDGKVVLKGSCSEILKEQPELEQDLKLFKAFYWWDVDYINENWDKGKFIKCREKYLVDPSGSTSKNKLSMILADFHGHIADTFGLENMPHKLSDIDCPLHISLGTEDANVPPNSIINFARKSRENSNYNDEIDLYEGSSHLFGIPYLGFILNANWPARSNVFIDFGDIPRDGEHGNNIKKRWEKSMSLYDKYLM